MLSLSDLGVDLSAPGNTDVAGDEVNPAARSLGNKQSYACMSKLFDDLAALDKKIADPWKIRTRDNDKHVLSPADVDFILADVIRSARITDITEKQGSAIVMLANTSLATNATKSCAAVAGAIGRPQICHHE
jgi:hypothetical protein